MDTMIKIIRQLEQVFNFHGSIHYVSIFVNKTSLMQFFKYLLYPRQLELDPERHTTCTHIHNSAPEDGWM